MWYAILMTVLGSVVLPVSVVCLFLIWLAWRSFMSFCNLIDSLFDRLIDRLVNEVLNEYIGGYYRAHGRRQDDGYVSAETKGMGALFIRQADQANGDSIT